MTIAFTTENMGDYLYVSVFGTIATVDDVLRYGFSITSDTEELGLKKVLIDYRQTTINFGFFDAVLLAKHVENSKFTYRGLKIAHIVRPEDMPLFEDYKTPALNRGFIFESFSDKDEAIAWLTGN